MLPNVAVTHPTPPREVRTARLVLRAPDPRLVHPIVGFQARNVDHFGPWDPPRPAGYGSVDATAARLDQERIAFGSGLAWRYWISVADTSEVIGQCQVSGVQRGPFQSATLGYSLDLGLLGQGLMTEALNAVISQVFAPAVRLHRLQAAVRPENDRSKRVLHRLGFTREGYSPGYLFIDGAWRDHEVFSLVNDAWPREEAP